MKQKAPRVVVLALVIIVANLVVTQLGRNFLPRSLPETTHPSPAAARMGTLPHLMLWAWEHPEDVRFIDPQEVGVAFLAATIYLQRGDVVVRPRLQPLMVPPHTKLVAVVRIETNEYPLISERPDCSPTQRSRAAAAIADLGSIGGVRGVQIDFDATVSERPFYSDLLSEVRRLLPRSKALLITAMASWCAGDPWVRALPVDDAVPMLFRMGSDRREILRDLAEGRKFGPMVCRQSVGISMDEPLVQIPPAPRVYIFRPGPWTRESFDRILGQVNHQ